MEKLYTKLKLRKLIWKAYYANTHGRFTSYHLNILGCIVVFVL